MPNRVTAQFALSVKRRIAALPCAVCGVPYDTECDHIDPASLGGPSTVDNAQPLCGRCNRKKHNRLSNAKIAAWVRSRGLLHFVEAIERELRRYGWYSGLQHDLKLRLPEAVTLHHDFLEKWGFTDA